MSERVCRARTWGGLVLMVWISATATAVSAATEARAARDAGEAWARASQAVSALQEMSYRGDVTVEAVAAQLDVVAVALQGVDETAQGMYLRAEAHRLAGGALARVEPGRAAAARVAAVEFAQSLRLSHRHQVVGQLGYIVEARVERDRERWAAAEALLEPVVDAAGRSREPAVMRIGLLAELERLDVMLGRGEARDVLTMLRRIGLRYEAVLGEDATTPLRWMAARALTALAGQTKDVRDRAAAIEALREPVLVEAVPTYERLALLAELELVNGVAESTAESQREVMNVAERRAWAMQLARLVRDEQAAAAFEQLVEEDVDGMNARAWATWGEVRWRRDALIEAADAFERALKVDDAAVDAVERARWRQRLAAVLEAALADEPGDAVRRGRAADALLDVVDASALAIDDRQMALRRWVALVDGDDERGDAATVAAVLDERKRLVDGDVVLRYVALSKRWRVVRDVSAEGPGMAAALLAVRDAALAVDEPIVASHAALLAATIYGHWQIDRPRDVLAALERAWAAALASPHTAGKAVDRRVSALLQLGLVDAAAAVVEEAGEAAGPSSATLLSLAEALAARYAGSGAAERDRLRQRVSSLVNRALVDERTTAEQQYRAAQALLRVALPSEARRLVERSLADDAEAMASGEADLPGRLLIVASLREEGRLDAAVAAGKALLDRYPRSSMVYLEHAASWQAVGNESEALEAYRDARRYAVAGSATWWRATLGVAETLDATGDHDAARQVLRIAATLYPVDDPPTLRQQIRALQTRLEARQE